MLKGEQLVDVYIVTYNRATYLKECISSVLKQTFKEFELTIIDNCSTDETQKVVKSFSDDRIKYIRHEKNIGGIGNICYAYQLSKKKYFVIFHDDDIMKPNYLEEQVKTMEHNKDISILSCQTTLIDEYSNIIKEYQCIIEETIKRYSGNELFKAYLYERKFINFPTIMYRTDYIRESGVLIIPEAGPSADIYFCMDVERNGGVVAILNKALVNYRIHSEQDTQRSRVKMVCMLFEYMKSQRYYYELLNDNKRGQNKYYKKIMYNEVCLFAAEKIDINELKEDKKKYEEVFDVSFATKIAMKCVMGICRSVPGIVKGVYKKGKVTKMRRDVGEDK